MRFTKGITGVLALAATAAFASALSAQTLQVLTAGSSAQFGPFAEAAWALATNGGVTAYHYTAKSGSCTDTTGTNPSSGVTTDGFGSGSSCFAYLFDQRNSTTVDIVPEPGNLWVVWSSNGIWAYLSVDSTVGVRAFQAAPRALLEIGSTAPASGSSAYNSYFDGNADTPLTTTVSTALNGAKLTAANTDIRPEDALFATNRSLNTLGYGTVADTRSGHSGQYLIGDGIKSAFGSSVAHPVSFSISGADPFNTTQTPPAVIFLANASSSSVTASATNITTTNAGKLFSGTSCDSSMLGLTSGTVLNPILREPLSGTMNTAQYSAFWPTYDQENNINDSNGLPATGINALNLLCSSGSGYRYRAIGTGDEVKAVQDAESVSSGLHGAGSAVANAVGYAFFSYESTAPSSTYPYHYLTVTTSANSNVDPLAYTTSGGTTSTYSGALPACSTSGGVYDCPIVGGGSFLTLRNGTYPVWSVYRLITDSTNQTNAQALVTKAESLVDNTIPDFVPFDPQCSLTASGKNDLGLAVYREHYLPSTISSTPDAITITPNDGPRNTTNVSCTVVSGSYPHLTLGGQITAGTNTEAGGDVGGAIQGPFTKSNLPSVPGATQTANH
jgi:hypothetical protein